MEATPAVAEMDALDALVESRIDLALTPAVRAKLAARGISEEYARAHLRQKVAFGLAAEFGAGL